MDGARLGGLLTLSSLPFVAVFILSPDDCLRRGAPVATRCTSFVDDVACRQFLTLDEVEGPRQMSGVPSHLGDDVIPLLAQHLSLPFSYCAGL
mmetsp:Transcript_1894/g.4835  ORF Transcript_1894/g.4835 Transcript_1894/m.4835 type:complete len:93 (+) Transcript_1894:1507-1785(+)